MAGTPVIVGKQAAEASDPYSLADGESLTFSASNLSGNEKIEFILEDGEDTPIRKDGVTVFLSATNNIVKISGPLDFYLSKPSTQGLVAVYSYGG